VRARRVSGGLLDRVPAAALESFAGVGFPFLAGVIRDGDVVLDIGSGSGTDVFIARHFTGAAGRVIGLDMTAAMREKLARRAAAARLRNIDVHSFLQAGRRDVRVLNAYDYFAGSDNAETRKVAGQFGAHAIVLTALAPAV
jgi:SAM-dependent methyltransferase